MNLYKSIKIITFYFSIVILLSLIGYGCNTQPKEPETIQWYNLDVELTFKDSSKDTININVYTDNEPASEEELYAEMEIEDGNFEYWRATKEDFVVARKISRASFVQRFKILNYSLIIEENDN